MDCAPRTSAAGVLVGSAKNSGVGAGFGVGAARVGTTPARAASGDGCTTTVGVASGVAVAVGIVVGVGGRATSMRCESSESLTVMIVPAAKRRKATPMVDANAACANVICFSRSITVPP